MTIDICCQTFYRAAVFVAPSGIITRYPDTLKAVKYSVKRSVGVTQSNNNRKVYWTTNTIGGHVIFLLAQYKPAEEVHFAMRT